MDEIEQNFKRQFKKGSLEMVLISLIIENETYGYEIVNKLNQKGGLILGLTREGTVYPILHRLEENKIIQSKMVYSSANGGNKKCYSITEKGKKHYEKMLKFWDEYVSCVNLFIEKGDLS